MTAVSPPRSAGPALARRLVEATSVAIVGASSRPDAVGAVALEQLAAGGFGGRILPVNPRHAEVAGLPCVPSLRDLRDPPDLAILAVPDHALEDQIELAAACGIGSVVVFGGFSEVAPGDGRPSLSDRLGTIARRHGLAMCGPNGMGFIDFAHELRAVGFYEPLTRRPGTVSVLSQSGSVFSALLHNDRGLDFDLAVSTGQEAALTLADYLLYVLERDTTSVIGLFLETVRDVPAFTAAVRDALNLDVPVVALKVGRTPAAKELVRAHSGGLAGDDAAYEALFDRYGVARVRTLDEFMDTLELFRSPRRAATGGLAAVHDSGGERAHLVDLADDAGIEFATIGAETTTRLEARLELGLQPTNPLDAWGSGRDFEGAYVDHLLALHDDPDTAVLAFAVDLTTEGSDDVGYVRVARDVQAATTKPFVVLAHLTSGIDHEDASRVRAHGVPVLEGTGSGLAAIRHLLDRRDAVRHPPPSGPAGPDPAVAAAWMPCLQAGTALDETTSLALLRDYGIPVVDHHTATTMDAALAVADALGWPVVLKTATPGIDHKTDVGGVHLDLRGPDDLRRAYVAVAQRLGGVVLVSRMLEPGVELALGLLRDPQFGPVLVVGAGGTLVELLDDRQVALPPLDPAGARRLLDRLAVRRLLDGARGAPPADLDAVAAALAALSSLAEQLGDHLDAVDVNPLVAGPDGCVAVDALVIPRSVTRGGG